MRIRLTPTILTAAATVAVILGFVGSWNLFSKMNPYQSLMPGNGLTQISQLDMTGVELRGRHEGNPSWQMKAASFTISADRMSAEANDLSDGVYYRNSRPFVHFTAQEMRYSMQPFQREPSLIINGQASLWTGPAKARLQSPISISSSNIQWDGESEQAICPTVVKFVVGNVGSGTASSLIIDQIRKTLRFGAINAIAQLPPTTNQNLTLATSPPTTATKAEQSTSDTVTYSGEQGAFFDENTDIGTLLGQVKFRQGGAEVDMDGATWNRKTDIATSSSPVTITDNDTKLTGDSGVVDFETHLAIVKGHVVMLVIPKPTDKIKNDEQQIKKPTTILCDQVNYDYRAKKARTTGTVTITQTNRTITADNADYDVSAKIIDLDGNVFGKTTDGGVLRSPKAKISVDENDEWIQLFGPISGQMAVASQDNPLDTTNSSASSAKTKPTHSATK